ncbi:MAG: translocation/assembly module TamB domain-containing protein [Deltaproteobacteria bacterium]|nr:translocation/assembly module TamB domain-containing protein [Deltaproteobacteria bacterium]
MEFSETPIRTQASGQTVFFDSTDLPTAAGNLAFAGHITLDPAGQAFVGVLERFSIRGRVKVDLKQPARIRCTPDGTLSVEGFEADGPHGHISANGSISREDKFNVVFRLEGADLHAFIPSWVPASIGTLDSELTLQGDWQGLLSHTGVTVDVTLSGGRLRTEWGIPPMESLDVKARLERRSLEIRSFEGLLGGAPFRVTGRIENPGTLSENGRVDLSLHGDNLLLLRSEEIRLRAAADLRLAGPFSRPELSGMLFTTDGRYEKNFELLGGVRGVAPKSSASFLELLSIRSQAFQDVVFDVTVTGTMPFDIRNNRVRTAARPKLRLTGTGEKPILTGRVFFNASTLYLPGGRMQFDPGTVRFQPPDPNRPLLEFNGRGRLQGYDVVAVVEGPYDQPTVTLSSSPVLANEELLLLVLSGQPPKTRRAMDSEKSRNLDVAFFLGKDMMSRIEGPGSNTSAQSVMDRFEVDVGRNITPSGDETVRVLFRVANDLFREGDTLSLSGEKDSYGYYNGGVRIAFRFR